MFSRLMHRIPQFVLAALMSATAVAHAQTASNIYARVARSVGIVIVTTFEDQLVASGSAVTVSSQTMVTNRHVLLPGHRYHVLVNGARHEAYMTTCDSVQDLCLLNVNGLEARPVEFADANRLAVGDPVYAIGAPNEIGNVIGVTAVTKQKSYTPLQLTLSNGLITALRPVEDGNVIQTNAAISPGSSGGGLFDAQGRLVGITTFGMRNAQGLNMALPVNWVERLGVTGAPRSDPNASQIAMTPTAPPAPMRPATQETPDTVAEDIDTSPQRMVPAQSRSEPTNSIQALPKAWLAAPVALLLLLLWRRKRTTTEIGLDDEPSIDPLLQSFMAQAAREIDEQKADAVLWAKMSNEHKRNPQTSRDVYIQRRAAQLLSAEKDRKWAEAARQAT